MYVSLRLFALQFLALAYMYMYMYMYAGFHNYRGRLEGGKGEKGNIPL